MDRPLPEAVEVERSVLGSILVDGSVIHHVLELMSHEGYFYLESHRKIFKAMMNLAERNEPIDLVTLREELVRQKALEASGGELYLMELMEGVASSANVEYYVKIMVDYAIKRSLIQSCTAIIKDCHESKEAADEILDQAESKIFSISEDRIKAGFIHIKELLPQSFDEIERYSKGEILGVPTGFKDVDHLILGLQKSDFIIIAGRPSSGKTSFALNIAQNTAIRSKIPVAFFSLEMSKNQIVQRVLCSEARINLHTLRLGRLPEKYFPRLSFAAGPIAKAPFFIDDSSTLSVLEIRAKSRRLKAKENIGLIIIDYLQLIRGSHSIENRQQEIAQISRSLKGLAKDLQIPVVALSQLKRPIEARSSDPRPKLADLRESGAIEQDADVVMFVYHEGRDKGVAEEDVKSHILISKQRNGPIGDVPIKFNSDYTRFDDFTDEIPPVNSMNKTI